MVACSQCQHLEGRGGGIPGADWIETSCWWTPVHLRCPASMKTGGGVLWGTLLMSPRASTQGNTQSATPVRRTHLQEDQASWTPALFSLHPGCCLDVANLLMPLLPCLHTECQKEPFPLADVFPWQQEE